jgi:ABC-type nitrate/sulfonate/bicarbonate transport system substrate-binding protein
MGGFVVKKKVLACVVLFSLPLLLASLLAGCDGTQKEPGSKELKKVTVILDWTPNTNHTGVYAAQKLGYYQEQGLAVEILQPGEGGATQLIAAGQGDFGFSYQEEITIARTKGIPVKALAAVIQHNTSGFASPAEKNIKNPRDFEGKKYGGWGSPAEEAMLKALMKQEQADFGKVEMINIGAADYFTSVRRDVDFAWIFMGWTGIEAELKGLPINFVFLKDYHDALNFYTPVLIANEETISGNPQLVQSFMRATVKGYRYCIENPRAAGEILLESVPELNRDLVLESQEYLAREYQSDAPVWGEMSEIRWKKYAEWMYDQGLIDQPLEPGKAFTNEFLTGV